MTISNLPALFGIMFSLAIVPDTSAFAVASRSITSGLAHGIATTLGIVIGDFVFILFAVYGLSSLAESYEGLFVVLKYLGGAYLIWMGVSLWRSRTKVVTMEEMTEFSWLSSFLCGLLITLGDPKAILFYVSLLPAFLDFSRVSLVDTGIIMGLAIITAGGAKLGYAYMADSARLLFKNPEAKEKINKVAGGVMICTGVFVVV